jgi:acetyl esterase/lipase
VAPDKASGAKQSIQVTPRAVMQLRKLMKEGERYLRLSVSRDLRFQLDVESKFDPKEDYLVESEGMAIIVEPIAARLAFAGLRIDFLDEPGRQGFKIDLPETGPLVPDTSVSLVEARRGFKTTLARRESGGEAAPKPPAELFRLVRYEGPTGKLAAYLTPDPKDGKKHPAIVWITGGDCNSIDQGCWKEGPAQNDQSASAYRKSGIVMMIPSLRGGNDNPGVKEGFLGEVDDILAATEFLRKQPHVDPERIYLGGHSTGGTLALLTAECTDRFRAVFSFGPADYIVGYAPVYNPFMLSDQREVLLRSPVLWLHSIRVPVFVFEGAKGNQSALKNLARTSKNPKVRFFDVAGTDHFSILAPTNRLIAERILGDTGPTCNLAFSEAELNKLLPRKPE